MGMFDTVMIMCPSCGKITKQQSKMGECMLREYTLAEAPLAVLSDMKYDSDHDGLHCEHCKIKFILNIETRIKLTTESHSEE